MCYCSSFLSLIQNRRKCWRLNPQSILTEIMLRIGSIERFESNRFISKNVSFPLVIRRSEIDVTRYISLLVRTNAWSICAIYQRLSCHIMIHSQRPTMPILMITYRQILTTHQLRPTGGFFFFLEDVYGWPLTAFQGNLGHPVVHEILWVTRQWTVFFVRINLVWCCPEPLGTVLILSRASAVIKSRPGVVLEILTSF